MVWRWRVPAMKWTFPRWAMSLGLDVRRWALAWVDCTKKWIHWLSWNLKHQTSATNLPYKWWLLEFSAIFICVFSFIGIKDADRALPCPALPCLFFSVPSKFSESVKKMEKQRNLDAQNLKAQLDSIHDVLDTKARHRLMVCHRSCH